MWLKEFIPEEPPADQEEYRRLVWHMARTHYGIALDYQRFKPRLEEVVRTNERFERGALITRWVIYMIVGAISFFYGIKQLAEVWVWVKERL